MPAQRHSREAGYPDRIRTKRRFHRDSRRRGRSNSPDAVEQWDSDTEDDESLERKIARLRREVAEVKGEIDRRKAEDIKGSSVPAHHPEHDHPEHEIDALNKILRDASVSTFNVSQTQPVKISAPGLRGPSTSLNIASQESFRQSQEILDNAVKHAPTSQQTHMLSKVAEFDERLTLIETALGVNTLPLAAQERLASKAVFPILDNLDRQLFTVSSSADSLLDSIESKVTQLTENAQKLDEARTSAKVAQEALYESSTQLKQSQTSSDEIKRLVEIEDFEQTTKINALYGTLATIESLDPLLHSVLDRLRSLQPIHTDAKNASETLARSEARQESIREDLTSWRDCLERIEEVLNQEELKLSGNVHGLEALVKDLEGKMQQLGK